MSMATGEPHPLAAGGWIEHDLWEPVDLNFLSCRILMVSVSDHVLAAFAKHRVILWNWRTGDEILVSLISST